MSDIAAPVRTIVSFPPPFMQNNSVVVVDKIIDDFLPFPVGIDLSADPIVIPLFTGESFEVHSSTGVNWEHDFKSQHHSSVMWLFSLQSVGRLLSNYRDTEAPEILDTCVRVLNSFFDYISKPETSDKVWLIASVDHSTATRVRVLVKFFNTLNSLPAPDPILLGKILTHLKSCSDWLLQDANYRKNNHGLMSSSSLLHTATLFSGEPFADQYRDVAINRIVELIEESFDKDGYCNENTPGYHRFNLHLYTVLLGFCKNYQISNQLETYLQNHIERAAEALRYCLRQDGTVPPIGDSPVYPTNFKSINKSKFFEESCFAIVKNDDLYLSIVCGSPSEIHKQADDSSMTLRYKNKDIITDGGSYLYDRTNPHRRCVESTYGHSGIFLKAFDGLLRSQYVRKFGPLSGRIHLFDEAADGVKIYCSYGIQNNKITFHRYIYVRWPDEIAIVDKIAHSEALTGVPAVCVERFLFAPSVEVVAGKPHIFHLINGAARHTLFQLADCRADLYRGESGDVYRGWHSCKNNEILAVWGIDFLTKKPDPAFAVIFNLSGIVSKIDETSHEIRQFAAGNDPFFDKASDFKL